MQDPFTLAEFFEESSPIRIAFNSLYLSKYFGMVTTEQKEGNCVEHVLTAERLPADQNSNPQV